MDASSFVGTGRALSVAAGRIFYIHGLKVIIRLSFVGLLVVELGFWSDHWRFVLRMMTSK